MGIVLLIFIFRLLLVSMLFLGMCSGRGLFVLNEGVQVSFVNRLLVFCDGFVMFCRIEFRVMLLMIWLLRWDLWVLFLLLLVSNLELMSFWYSIIVGLVFWVVNCFVQFRVVLLVWLGRFCMCRVYCLFDVRIFDLVLYIFLVFIVYGLMVMC